METPPFRIQGREPLFPKLMWNRPVTRQGAGNLLVVGGHSGEFSFPTALYSYAMAAGVGECHVILPSSLIQTLGGTAGVSFAPSTRSGSLAREALGAILEAAEQADAVMVGGSLSNNSDTAILIESLVRKLEQPTVIYGDALEALHLSPQIVTNRPDHLVIITMPELFKIAGRLLIPIKIRRDGGLMNKLEIVHAVARETKCQWVVYGTEIIVASEGQYTSTPIPFTLSRQAAAIIATLSVFWLQNQTAPLEGLTMGAFVLSQAAEAAKEGLATSLLTKAIRETLVALSA